MAEDKGITVTINKGDYDMFTLDVDAIVNPCNVLGVEGGGLSLIFKNKFPDNSIEYRRACNDKELVRGVVHYTVNPDRKPRIIFNFPSKPDFRIPSQLKDITNALPDFLDKIKVCMEKHDLKSIAIPALGCGLGYLDWQDVSAILYNAFTKNKFEKNLEVYLINPK